MLRDNNPLNPRPPTPPKHTHDIPPLRVHPQRDRPVLSTHPSRPRRATRRRIPSSRTVPRVKGHRLIRPQPIRRHQQTAQTAADDRDVPRRPRVRVDRRIVRGCGGWERDAGDLGPSTRVFKIYTAVVEGVVETGSSAFEAADERA